MSTTTIRVSERTHQMIAMLAREADTPMSELVERAVEQYRRAHIIAEANRAYAALRADPEAWAEVQGERAAWDGTIADGLPQEHA
jgi:predicted transcriptional regulator